MSDIVERLRGNGQRAYFGDGAIMYDAADEIERLRAENFRVAAIACDTPTMGEWGNKGCAEIERLRAMVDALLDHCPDGECEECSRIVCPHGDVLHLHHDGCPSCYLAARRTALEEK